MRTYSKMSTPGIFLLLAVAFYIAAISPAFAALKDENLLAGLPPGFKVGSHSEQTKSSTNEFVPANETIDNWTKMITVQIFPNLPNFAPDTFATKMSDMWKAACAGGNAQKIRDGVENGYSFSLWMFNCPMNPQTKKPENMWVKAISGQDALYTVQYAYRQSVDKDKITPAMEYLRQVEVCDTRRPDRACPVN